MSPLPNASTYKKMTQGKIRKIDRFQMRDIETKKIKITFKNEMAARDYFHSMRFGLSNFYEIYDTLINKIILNGTYKSKENLL